MPISPYQRKHIEELQEQAFELYKTGKTLHEVGKLLNKSHGWVFNAVHAQEKKRRKRAR